MPVIFGRATARIRRTASGRRLSPAPAFAIAAAVLVAAMLWSAEVGAADLNPVSVAEALLDKIPFVHIDSGLSPLDQAILFQIRLPRVVLGALVGALLAVAGAGYQGVLRNVLVDSSLLGSSAGAGLGATIAIIYLDGSNPAALPIAAFVGALLGVATAYAAGSSARGGVTTLLLCGLAVGMFLSAIQTYLLQRSTEDLQRVYSWMLGSVAAADWHTVLSILPYSAVSVGLLLLHGRHLDVLAVGDEEATALGLNARRVRLIVVASASLAAATAVSVSGLIGFVGIVMPHAVRRLAGPSYRVLLPLSLLSGAAFLVVADTVARTVVAPAELPIGVVTAFIGAPAFILILRRTRLVST
jgi:iron complex transport system permease protein